MKYNPIKSPEQCQNMHDIRMEIDNIDYTIIHLLSTRFEYVKSASKFKTNTADVEAKARFDSMLEQRKEWAGKLGLDGEVIKDLYSNLVNYFISEELKHFNHK
ncbi:chorismate mutase [Orbus wheelerorum]|uniref:chorismate mutase n=1 Tax=Orbus wheelerorum TaxID=3074111 RepID=UPI00370D6E84